MKLAVVTPIPTPYRDPFWNEVARQPDVDLHVYYCSAGKADRPWRVGWKREYQAQVLPGKNLSQWRGADASCYWNPQIKDRLRSGGFDAIVVGGYNHPTMWAAMRYAVRHQVPYFLMCETYAREGRPALRRWAKRLPVRWAVRHASGGFPTGSLAEDYLVHYGAARQTLTRIPNVPDVAGLAATVDELQGNRQQLRAEHGLSDRPLVLFAGRLIPKKRADLLIRAFAEAAPNGEAQLVIVGDGPERPMLESLIDQLGLRDRVRLAGFVQPPEMPKWYAMADLFVLPSSETWGVVVLEALASGVPVIVTDEVGCHPDVLNNPAVGEAVPARAEGALASALMRRLGSPISRESVAQIWSPVRQSLTYEVLASRIVGSIQQVVEATTRRVSGISCIACRTDPREAAASR